MKPRSNKSKRTRKRIVAKHLADELGVSISTISRAFTPDTRISPKTKAKILEYAASIGYQPNPYAQSLTTQNNTIVGIVVSDISNNPFYPEALARLSDALRQAGYNAMLFPVSEGQTPDDVLPQALAFEPEFVIVLAATVSSQATVFAAEGGTNLIFFSRYVPGSPTFSVTCDNADGGRAIAEHLVECGHTRLAYIAGTPKTSTNRDRWTGFSERCTELGVTDVHKEETGIFSYDSGYQAALRMFARSARPEAIFCANDIVALGAMDALRGELGLKVPDDVSVAGFDNIFMSGWPSHSLTTYNYPLEQMIAQTMMLIERISNDPDYDPISVVVPGHLVVRSSTRARNGQDEHPAG